MELREAWRRVGGLVPPLLGAAVLGSLLGTGSFVALLVAEWPTRIQDPLEPLILVLMASLYAMPVAILCLLVLGVPAALLLRNHARQWWVPLLAAITGAVVGQIVAYTLGFHAWGVGPFSLLNAGTLTGAITAVLWYRFAKPRILSDEKE